MKKEMNLMLLNLAIADLTFLMTVVPVTAYK